MQTQVQIVVGLYPAVLYNSLKVFLILCSCFISSLPLDAFDEALDSDWNGRVAYFLEMIEASDETFGTDKVYISLWIDDYLMNFPYIVRQIYQIEVYSKYV